MMAKEVVSRNFDVEAVSIFVHSVHFFELIYTPLSFTTMNATLSSTIETSVIADGIAITPSNEVGVFFARNGAVSELAINPVPFDRISKAVTLLLIFSHDAVAFCARTNNTIAKN